ncbi:hypothetical protein [Acidovorax sp. 69]|nr:hypothetical protein [Acidovorax sp. 69]
MTQPIGPTALAAVSEAQRGQVCICAACGAAYSSGQRPFANGAPPAPI